MKPCPLIEVREALHLSGLALAQLAGISSTRVRDVEAGRVPTIPGAILAVLSPYADTEKLIELHAAWFEGLSEEARATAEEWSKLSAPYGGNVDGGATPENLQALRDQAKEFRKGRSERLGSSK